MNTFKFQALRLCTEEQKDDKDRATSEKSSSYVSHNTGCPRNLPFVQAGKVELARQWWHPLIL